MPQIIRHHFGRAGFKQLHTQQQVIRFLLQPLADQPHIPLLLRLTHRVVQPHPHIPVVVQNGFTQREHRDLRSRNHKMLVDRALKVQAGNHTHNARRRKIRIVPF